MSLIRRILPTFLIQTSLLASAWTYPDGIEVNASPFEEGFGTEESPYIIRNAQQLADLSWFVNQGKNTEAYFALGNDITLNESGGKQQWTPIGSRNRPFSGHFDGRGHKIHGLYIGSYEPEKTGQYTYHAYIGLFGYTTGAAISNVTLDNADLQITGVSCNDSQYIYVGSVVAGANEGSITGCTASGNINCSVDIDRTNVTVGGVVGELYLGNELSGCTYSGNITVDNPQGSHTIDNGVGGVAGIVNFVKKCFDCTNRANVTVSSGELVAGGIAANINLDYSQDESGTVKNLVNYGNINCVKGTCAGIAYWFSCNDITECHNYGKVSTDRERKGGCYGITSDSHFNKMTKCSNNAEVDGTGLVGYGDFLTLVEDCSNNADVHGPGILGGCGPYELTIRRCVNKGKARDAGIVSAGAGCGLIMEDCDNYGDVTGRAGIVSEVTSYPMDITLTRCNNYGNVDGSDDYSTYSPGSGYYTYYTSKIGGIIDSAGKIVMKECRNSGNVTGPLKVGGLIGACSDIDMDNCHNSGNVNSLRNPNITVQFSYEPNAGGIVGEGSSYTDQDLGIRACSNSGVVTMDCDSHPQNIYSNHAAIGGIAGSFSGKINKSFNTGNINVLGNGMAGGLVGSASNATFKECYNTGDLTGGADYAGGFAGFANISRFNDCYTAGKLYSDEGTVSGFTAYSYGVGIYSSFSYIEMKGRTYYQGAYCPGWSNTLSNVFLLDNPGISFTENEPGHIDGDVSVASTKLFASGEICTRLNNGRENAPWGQVTEEDPYPLLNGKGTGILDTEINVEAHWTIYDYSGRFVKSGYGYIDDVTRSLPSGFYIATAPRHPSRRLFIGR